MKFALIMMCTLLLSACATKWTKPDGTQQEFAEDKYTCMQQAPATAGFGLYGMAFAEQKQKQYFSACMNAKGWYPQ